MDFPSIALLTDFGNRDGFVGVMKGVLLSRLTQPVPIVDISHQIEPQNIRQALWTLESAYRYFPAKTIFVTVVDPGVGTQEQASLLAFWPERQQVFIAPDNGLLTPIYETADEALQVFDIRHSELYLQDSLSLHGRSQTFHGRDVYAPIAALTANAFLAGELPQFLAQFGLLDTKPVKLTRQKPHIIEEDNQSTMHGEIIACDHFGNLITNIPNGWMKPGQTFILNINQQASRPVVFQETYDGSADSQQLGKPLLLIPSSGGTVELAINQGSTQQLFQATIGDTLTLELTL